MNLNKVALLELVLVVIFNFLAGLITYYIVFVYHVAIEVDPITSFLISSVGFETSFVLHLFFYILLYFLTLIGSRMTGMVYLPVIIFTILVGLTFWDFLNDLIVLYNVGGMI